MFTGADVTEKMGWGEALQSRVKVHLLILVALLVVFRFVNLHVLYFVQNRPVSIPFHDPLLESFQSMPDGTWINIIIFLTLCSLVGLFYKFPLRLILLGQAMLIMYCTRWVTMFLCPFAAPPGVTYIQDFVSYGGGQISRDLFFSGHTGLLVLLLLVSDGWKSRLFLTVMLFTLVALLLLGHIHYMIDIFCAPFFAYASFSMSRQVLCFLYGNQLFR